MIALAVIIVLLGIYEAFLKLGLVPKIHFLSIGKWQQVTKNISVSYRSVALV